jgi:hypothetical protein
MDKCSACGTIVIATPCDLCGGYTCHRCAALEVKKDALVVRHKVCKRRK